MDYNEVGRISNDALEFIADRINARIASHNQKIGVTCPYDWRICVNEERDSLHTAL